MWGLDACIYAKSVRWTLASSDEKTGTALPGEQAYCHIQSLGPRRVGGVVGPGSGSGQWTCKWVKPKTNRTHFWLHWGSCVDLWLKELTDKIKHALCPAVAAGDRHIFWAGCFFKKGSRRVEEEPHTRVTGHKFLVRKNASEFIVGDVCMQSKQ